jgi:hypothetical protein
MSPKLKPLLLPQLVEERRKMDVHSSVVSIPPPADMMPGELPYAYVTANSSASDITSPITPTFSASARGHVRGSSSSSSIELPQLQHDIPSSPVQAIGHKLSKRQLPDVMEEEPAEPAEWAYSQNDSVSSLSDQFGLYSCLCDQPCEHSRSSDDVFRYNMFSGSEVDVDYDIGCLSDGDCSVDPANSTYKRQTAGESPFIALTSRFGSRFNTIQRWRTSRKPSLMASPTTELRLENVMSRDPSTVNSRSSSMSAPPQHRQVDSLSHDHFTPTGPTLTIPPSYFDRMDDYDVSGPIDIDHEERQSIERDREVATTPLLPPFLNSPVAKPPVQSPLQSPNVAVFPNYTDMAPPSAPMSPPPPFSRPSLSSMPSVSSFHRPSCTSSMDLPLPLPAILQEHDEWSDRLGHANFTITPRPYELDEAAALSVDALAKYREDWDAARINYTKHLVRTGENYGQTSKIYGLTEAKWAETERRWADNYESALRQQPTSTTIKRSSGPQSVPMTPSSSSRSRSRGRARGRSRSGSTSTSIMGRLPHHNEDAFAGMEWRRLEHALNGANTGNAGLGLPSAVPRMLEALDADGKFPNRGDEDIVGPMHRDEVMIRAESEERKSSRFWRHLVDKVGLRK